MFELHLDFVNALTKQTVTGRLQWKRIGNGDLESLLSNTNPEKSFISQYKNIQIALITTKYNKLECYLIQQIDGINESTEIAYEYPSALDTLYYKVVNQVDNTLEAIMEEFISSI